MPKVRRASSLSLDRSRASPYPCTSDDSEPYNLKNPLESKENINEWEEARCPICMEHPHNAVLLKCSSHEKGCRPFMCNTSYRHSNCLDQFCKSSVPCCSTEILQELPLTITTSHSASEEQSMPGQISPCGDEWQQKPVCPLCRGEIYGYVVVEGARHYMNSKVRNCSSETCEFSGSYTELRKHARSEHPYVRPSEVDPTRHRDWVRLERERDLEDVLSLVQQGPGEDIVDESSGEFGSWMSLFVAMIRSVEVILVTRLMDSSSGSPSGREQMHNRRSGRMSRAHYHNDTVPLNATRRSNVVSDSTSRPRGLRWRAPNDDVETSRAPRWNHNTLSGETGHDSRWGNNILPHLSSRAPRWGNNFLQEETSRAPRWGNNLPEETTRAPRWGNNSLPEETSRAPRWGNTSAPENAPRLRGLRWRNQRWPTNNNNRR